jgi:hypothetical protein
MQASLVKRHLWQNTMGEFDEMPHSLTASCKNIARTARVAAQAQIKMITARVLTQAGKRHVSLAMDMEMLMDMLQPQYKQAVQSPAAHPAG